ncbi:MAG TPA: cytidine deaminase [Actinomycetota bacterium]
MSSVDQDRVRALLEAAREARDLAYAPYSGFRVGAAVLTADDRLVRGANVENAAYPLSVCAERTAIQRAVTEPGSREVVAVAFVSSGEGETWPCGGCRQVLHEFGPGMVVITEDAQGEPVQRLLAELLPEAFGPADLP